MNTTVEVAVQPDVVVEALRDLADVELLLIGGGDILINNG